MPQKRNPISSEIVIGLASLGSIFAGGFQLAMTPGHERASGEWQIEWDAVPLLCTATSSSVSQLAATLEGLVVMPERIAENLARHGHLIMSEAVMMAVAARIGRQQAHDLIYGISQRAIEEGVPFDLALAADEQVAVVLDVQELAQALNPRQYLGESVALTHAAVARWRERRVERIMQPRALSES